jgi:hypothetical protein
MKNWRSGLSNILVLVFLTGLAVLMITIFSSQSLRSAGPGSSPVPTAVGVQASPLSTPIAGSVPPARIGKPVLLSEVGQIGMLGSKDQSKFASVVRNGEDTTTVLVDVANDTKQVITNTALINAHVAGRWLAFEDRSSPKAGRNSSRIKILDLNTKQEIVLGNEDAEQHNVNISGDMVVWDEPQNGKVSKIYAYDLTRKKTIPVIVEPGVRGYPRISGEWITYVQWPGTNPTGRELGIELHAHSLKTNEDILIGLIPSPKDAGWGTQYALDEDKIVWSKFLNAQSELHLYDLTTRTDRKLLGPNDGWGYDLSISAQSGVIVMPQTVLDWRQREPVNVPFDQPEPIKMGKSFGTSFQVMGEYLVWRVSLDRDDSNVQVFTARITR